MLACLSVPCHAEPQTDIRGDLQAICCRMLAVKSPSVYDYSPASNRCSHALANMKWERETRVPLPYPTAPPLLCRQPVQCNRICWQQIAHLHIWGEKKHIFKMSPIWHRQVSVSGRHLHECWCKCRGEKFLWLLGRGNVQNNLMFLWLCSFKLIQIVIQKNLYSLGYKKIYRIFPPREG